MTLAQIIVTGLVNLLLSLAVLGLIVYVLTAYIPMPAPLKNVIIAVACIVGILVVARFFGILVI